ncbi:MAG TPA: DUF2182 domain-containing protein, partial [Acidobacteriota bacterium]|nr:DUF2182 domain-containing protein [Acidobacteriota bacterium]
MINEAIPGGDRTFWGISAFVFVASAAATIWLCGTMSGGMPMPGGWTMSMAWMTMPGQHALGAAAAFVAMWIVMMAAMMLPSLAPTLSNYRHAMHLADGGAGKPVFLAGTSYFLVWTGFGILAYFVGLGLVAMEMRSPTLARYVPILAGAVVLLAGAAQFSEWKARSLTRCCEMPACSSPVDSHAAWNYGLHLGLNCALCCAGFMAILLVL